jgi:hypothetical protein
MLAIEHPSFLWQFQLSEKDWFHYPQQSLEQDY